MFRPDQAGEKRVYDAAAASLNRRRNDLLAREGNRQRLVNEVTARASDVDRFLAGPTLANFERLARQSLQLPRETKALEEAKAPSRSRRKVVLSYSELCPRRRGNTTDKLRDAQEIDVIRTPNQK